jgi:hypothetical protein
MIKTAVSMILFLVLFLGEAGAADRNCIMLGWTGGAAGNDVKWVKGNVVQQGEVVRIRYNWKNGIMTGRLQKDGSLLGTWIQDGSDGGRFQLRIPDGGQARGWWSSNGDNNRERAAMIIQNCY